MRSEDLHDREVEHGERDEPRSEAAHQANATPEVPIEMDAEPPHPTIYSAPRRFDLATLLAVTVAYALLFTVMRVLRAHPVVFALVAGFFTAVAIGQALLFRGESPRAASVVVGAVYWTAALLLQFQWHPCAAIAAAIQGGLLGYIAGTLVGGVFLVAEAVRRHF